MQTNADRDQRRSLGGVHEAGRKEDGLLDEVHGMYTSPVTSLSRIPGKYPLTTGIASGPVWSVYQLRFRESSLLTLNADGRITTFGAPPPLEGTRFTQPPFKYPDDTYGDPLDYNPPPLPLPPDWPFPPLPEIPVPPIYPFDPFAPGDAFDNQQDDKTPLRPSVEYPSAQDYVLRIDPSSVVFSVPSDDPDINSRIRFWILQSQVDGADRYDKARVIWSAPWIHVGRDYVDVQEISSGGYINLFPAWTQNFVPYVQGSVWFSEPGASGRYEGAVIFMATDKNGKPRRNRQGGLVLAGLNVTLYYGSADLDVTPDELTYSFQQGS